MSKKSSGRFRSTILLVALVLLVAAVGRAHAQYIRTVVVSPVPGDVFASGNALLAAYNGVAGANAANRWLVKVEPGVFDLGTQMLQMKPYVDLEGSGRGMTKIRGAGHDSYLGATILLSDHSELRDAWAVNYGGDAYAIPILLASSSAASPRVTNVTTEGWGAPAAYGVRIASAYGSTPIVTHLDASATADGSSGSFSYGAVVRGEGTTTLSDSVLTASGAGTNDGLFIADFVQPKLTRLEIKASGGSSARGIEIVSVGGGSGSILELTFSQVTAGGASGQSSGVLNDYRTLDIRNSTIIATGPGSTAVSGGFSVDAGSIVSSKVQGDTATVDGIVRVGGSQLSGGPAGPLVTCAFVYDESFVPAVGCP